MYLINRIVDIYSKKYIQYIALLRTIYIKGEKLLKNDVYILAQALNIFGQILNTRHVSCTLSSEIVLEAKCIAHEIQIAEKTKSTPNYKYIAKKAERIKILAIQIVIDNKGRNIDF